MSDTHTNTLSTAFSAGRSFMLVRVQLVTRCPPSPSTLHQKSAGPAPLALPEDDTCWVTLDMQVQWQFHTDVQGDGSVLVELNCRAPVVCFASCVCLLQLVNWVFLNFQLRVKTSTPVYSIKVCFALVSLRVCLCVLRSVSLARAHTLSRVTCPAPRLNLCDTHALTLRSPWPCFDLVLFAATIGGAPWSDA